MKPTASINPDLSTELDVEADVNKEATGSEELANVLACLRTQEQVKRDREREAELAKLRERAKFD